MRLGWGTMPEHPARAAKMRRVPGVGETGTLTDGGGLPAGVILGKLHGPAVAPQRTVVADWGHRGATAPGGATEDWSARRPAAGRSRAVHPRPCARSPRAAPRR